LREGAQIDAAIFRQTGIWQRNIHVHANEGLVSPRWRLLFAEDCYIAERGWWHSIVTMT